MPKLSTRIFPRNNQPLAANPQNPASPFNGNETQWGTQGNGAPVRGVFPPEFVYDFATDKYYPTGPHFVRGTVDTITPVRNLSLLAAAAAGIKVV